MVPSELVVTRIEEARRTGARALNLSSCGLASVPEEVTQLTELRELDLSNNGLTTIPENIGQLRKLTGLHLSYNGLRELPESIGQLTDLSWLFLSANKLIKLPESIGQLTDLTWLFLNGNNLASLPRSLGQLRKLVRLRLAYNKLASRPKSLKYLASFTQLSELNLNSNGFTEFPEGIGQLITLTRLFLSRNQIVSIPDEICDLVSLVDLDLAGNQIISIPERIGQLSLLVSLDLSRNKLVSLPETIGMLRNLSWFNISNNLLTSLPESTSDLSGLKYVFLTNNRICSLPESIGKLTQLEGLNLRCNKLSSLPDSVAQFSWLELEDNELTSIPVSVVQANRLARLNIAKNFISSSPESLGRILEVTRLSSLNLSDNQLTRLPESIGRLGDLVTLDLSSNQLMTLPEHVCELSRLSSLNVDNNRLTYLPEKIGRLFGLSTLSLRGNQLTSLPDAMSVFGRLEFLDLRDNRLEIPPEVLSQPTRTGFICQYIDQVLVKKRNSRQDNFHFVNQSTEFPINEAKIILIGESGVGKTSLIKRLTTGSFDPNESVTNGINITHWKLKNVPVLAGLGARGETSTRNVAEEGQSGSILEERTIRLNIWDFGGQEIYYATHRFFLTGRTIYIFVLSARWTDEQNRIHYWLKTIRTLDKDAPILVVHNHYEGNPQQLDRQTLTANYPSIAQNGFHETSCAQNAGIAELKEAIRREVGKMRHVTDLLPTAYFVVKEWIEREAEAIDFLTGADFTALCNRASVTDESQQYDILRLLHALGAVVSFQDDPRLRDTTVLNPEWVTGGVYRILDDPRLKEAGHGILTATALSRVLSAVQTRYPHSRHQFLLDIMEKFELCFPRPGKPGEYLVPELLHTSEPEDIADFTDALRLELCYDFLPQSVLPRFIVRTSHMVQPYRWRKGVLLEEGGNRTLVRADTEANKITIAVAGNERTRRDFMSIVRSFFAEIHQAPETLTVEEYIPLAMYPNAKPVPYKFLRELEEKNKDRFDWQGVRDELNVHELLTGIERIRHQAQEPMSDTPLSTVPLSSLISPPTRTEVLERTDVLSVAPENTQYLNQLLDQAEKKRLVPFVGAGMTIPLGLPGWRQALEAVYQNAKPSLGIDDAVRYAEARTRGEWEEAAQALWDVPALGERWFNEQIKSLFGRYKLPSKVGGAVALLPRFATGPVLTTNFDAALEVIFEGAGQPFTSDQIVLGDYRADAMINRFDDGDRFLLKLHGDADESTGRILTKSQYDDAYANPNRKLPRLLNALFGSRRPILFMGCSLLTDRTMAELQKAGLHDDVTRHFALLEVPPTPDERIKRQNELIARYGVRPIWFARGDYAAIERILQSVVDAVAGTANKGTAASPPTTAGAPASPRTSIPTTSIVTPGTLPPSAGDRDRLIDFLEGITPADLGRVIIQVPGASQHDSDKLSVPERVSRLIQLVESSNGIQLPGLIAIVDNRFPKWRSNQ